MKVSQIIYTAKKLLNLSIADSIFDNSDKNTTDYEIASSQPLKTLLDCVNYVLDDIACDYAPNVQKSVVVAVDGFINLSQQNIPLLEVLKLSDASGRAVRFRYTANGLLTDRDGRFNLMYTARYPVAGFYDEVAVANAKIDIRIVAYGVAAEYCLLTGDYENMVIWDGRYKNCLASAHNTKYEKTVKERRWL